MVSEQLAGTEHVMFGVFDGHGSEGHVVSQVIAKALPKLIEDELYVAAVRITAVRP